MNYQLLKQGVKRIDDGACIPPTIDNIDWLEYQKWLALGNTPEPADPDPVPDPRVVTDEEEREAAKVDSAVLALINQTRAEWTTWAQTNFPTLTTAERTRMGTICWLLAVAIRRQVR